jgi:hypothetical protein
MTDELTLRDVARLLVELQPRQGGRPSEAGPLDPPLALLRTWQTRRLERTYIDLLESPRYRPACRFFLTDLYAPRDFSQRDQDVEQIYAWLSRVLPDTMLVLFKEVIELAYLTYELDYHLACALVDDLGVTDTINGTLYAQGYRICDNYVERSYQIDLIIRVGRRVGTGARQPLVGAALSLARLPAQSVGWGELYDFVRRGHAAFKNMGETRFFLQTIEARERRILDNIYASHPDPFSLDA